MARQLLTLSWIDVVTLKVETRTIHGKSSITNDCTDEIQKILLKKSINNFALISLY